MKRDVRVNRSLTIPAAEISLSFSPSGGPGGQHANRSSTRVDLAWDVAESAVLGPRQRARLMRTLSSRLDRSGVLHLSSDRFRSQSRNRDDVLDRLAVLVEDGLKVRRSRVPTKPSAGAVERRLKDKKRRAETKRARRPVEPD